MLGRKSRGVGMQSWRRRWREGTRTSLSNKETNSRLERERGGEGREGEEVVFSSIITGVMAVCCDSDFVNCVPN